MKIISFNLPNNVNLEMVEIPAGSFLMGSSEYEIEKRDNETPPHEVTLKSFYLGKFPITQAQWFAMMNDFPEMPETFRNDDFPVVNVWLEKAIGFCRKISHLTGENFRLPTEAEWEYACRAGTKTLFNFGNKISNKSVNYNFEFGNQLMPVGYFKDPNNFGLYDMHGNVWEWCADIWHENYIGAPTDGSAGLDGGDQGYCVQRGGAWNSNATSCRSAFRVGDIAHNNDNIVGLRVCFSKS